MKVVLDIKSTDFEGNIISSSTNAILEERQNDYKITYVENLSDTDKKTKTVIYVNANNARIVREGEVCYDFMFANELVHNTLYRSAYGGLPVTVTTREFSFWGNKMMAADDMFESYPGVSAGVGRPEMKIDIAYELAIEGTEPMDMKVSMQIK